jgi:hypothetical protein
MTSPGPFRAAFAAAAVLAATAAAAPLPAPPGTLAPGTYQQVDLVSKKPLPVGSELVIVAGKGGRVGFSINAVRALDSNQGFIAGGLQGPLPVTWTQAGRSGNCRLRFEAVPHGVRITQDLTFGNCGFDAGVTADGTYLLVAEKPIP